MFEMLLLRTGRLIAPDAWRSRTWRRFSGQFFRLCVTVSCLFLVGACSIPGNSDSSSGQPRLVHHQGQSWIALLFSDMVAQKEDYTCGAASLATVLRHYYGEDVDEATVLETSGVDEINKLTVGGGDEARTVSREAYNELSEAERQDVKISGFTYALLAKTAKRLNYRARGIKTDYKTLVNLKIPVIAYIETSSFHHFVVIRQVNEGWIYVADPTWGNRRYTRGQFLSYWAIDEGKDGKALGRILAILPQKGADNTHVEPGFFNPI